MLSVTSGMDITPDRESLHFTDLSVGNCDVIVSVVAMETTSGISGNNEPHTIKTNKDENLARRPTKYMSCFW